MSVNLSDNYAVEDYDVYLSGQSKGNLSEVQRRYADLWLADADLFRRQGLGHIILGFRAAPGAEPLNPAKPLRLAKELIVTALMPFMQQSRPTFLKGGRRKEKTNNSLRLHFVDQPAAGNDDGPSFSMLDGRRQPHRREADLAKRPRQRDQLYFPKFYTPNTFAGQLNAAAGDVGEESILRSPIHGSLSIVRDDLYVRVMVGGHNVYRIRLEFADLLEFSRHNGEVKPQTQIGRLLGPVAYQEAVFRKGKPEYMWPADEVSATHDKFWLRMGMESLERLAVHAKRGGGPTTSLDAFCPQFYPELPANVVASRRQPSRDWPQWAPTEWFQELLLKAVKPDALGTSSLFGLMSPVNGRFVGVERASSYCLFKFEDENGQSAVLPAPLSATALLAPGAEVKLGDHVADYVLREYYKTYEQLEEVTMGAISKLEDDFFAKHCYHPGSCGYGGKDQLVRADIAGKALSYRALNHWLDLSSMLRGYGEGDVDFVLSAPIPHDIAKFGFTFQANDVSYDFTPNSRR